MFWKNLRILRKHSSFLAAKLNKRVVTNYARYHKLVKKACHNHLLINEILDEI